MFRATMCPSSGETTVFMRHLVLVILCRWLSGMQVHMHKHSCFSWWWAHSSPKHVEIDKYTKNKYTKNKLSTKLALFTRLCRDAGQQNIRKYISFFWYFADRASQYIYLNINELDALNFIMSLFHASACFEHMWSSSGSQSCTIQPLVSSLWNK